MGKERREEKWKGRWVEKQSALHARPNGLADSNLYVYWFTFFI